ncbi:MAG: type II toxin-antitoxin system VapC family toxin [Anaerolineae bacterium]
MRILLDTHVFLWFISGDFRLPANFQKDIRNPNNEIVLSVVSLWETIIKYQIGKLPLPQPPETYLPHQRHRHMISSMPVDEASVARLATLPLIHRDPFDRLLICQALQHGMTFATVDEALKSYPMQFLAS